MQPLWTKKIMQPLRGKKKPATFRDQNKSCNCSGQIRNHATTQGEKNHATFRDQNKSCNLSGQQNHKTSGQIKTENFLRFVLR